MSVLSPGANAALPSRDLTFVVRHGTIPGADIDTSAFLVTANGKVRSDGDMCFYGQTSVANGAVVHAGAAVGETLFTLKLDRVPADIEKLVFVSTIHENRAAFSRLSEITIDAGGIAGRIPCDGMTETALIVSEIYRRNDAWKIRIVGQGFAGGLSVLANHLGVDISAPAPAIAPTRAPSRVSLEKRVASEAPRLIDLAKKATISLEKNRLSEVKARVGLVLDASGSMHDQYRYGKVQAVIERILPLAIHFDDDGELDVWAFAEKSQKLTSATLSNFEGYVERENGGWETWFRRLNAAINYEPAVIRDVIRHFSGQEVSEGSKGLFGSIFSSKASLTTALSPTLPAYVIFISDGGVGSDREIEELVIKSAKLPIFWQFVGIGGSNYGILERFDTLTGRAVDNCNFFALDDLHSIPDQELYDRLLSEFPMWLKEAKRAGIIP